MAAGVSILSDLPYSMSEARIGEISREMETGKRAPQKQYKKSRWIYLCMFCKATEQCSRLERASLIEDSILSCVMVKLEMD